MITPEIVKQWLEWNDIGYSYAEIAIMAHTHQHIDTTKNVVAGRIWRAQRAKPPTPEKHKRYHGSIWSRR